MVRAAREALVAAWPRIVRQPSNRTQALARGERRYAGAKAAEQAERARQTRAAERSNLHENMGGGGGGFGGG
jgi:hypothetical protein